MTVKPITIKMDETTHLRIKMLAVEAGMTIGEAIEILVASGEARVEGARRDKLIPQKPAIPSRDKSLMGHATLYYLKMMIPLDAGLESQKDFKETLRTFQIHDLKWQHEMEKARNAIEDEITALKEKQGSITTEQIEEITSRHYSKAK